MSTAVIKTAATALGVALAIAVSGTAAAAPAAGATAAEPPSVAVKAGAKPKGAVRARRAHKPRVKPASRRAGRGARRALTRPQAGFYGCSNWHIVSGVWVYDCWWRNVSSSAPPGAHIIGWAETVHWYHERWYYAGNGRVALWFARHL